MLKQLERSDEALGHKEENDKSQYRPLVTTYDLSLLNIETRHPVEKIIAALKNKGVQILLDAVVEYLPSPDDVPPLIGINPKTKEEEPRRPSDDEPFAALAFKIVTDQHLGRLAYFRVYSGKLVQGTSVYNSTRQKTERSSRNMMSPGWGVYGSTGPRKP